MITKQLCNDFRADAIKALEDVAKKHGLSLAGDQSIQYGFDFMSFKNLEFRVGSTQEAEKREFERVCGAFGFSADDYLAKFSYKGEVYELFEFKLGGRVSKPVHLRRLKDNAVYCVDLKFREYFNKVN